MISSYEMRLKLLTWQRIVSNLTTETYFGSSKLYSWSCKTYKAGTSDQTILNMYRKFSDYDNFASVQCVLALLAQIDMDLAILYKEEVKIRIRQSKRSGLYSYIWSYSPALLNQSALVFPNQDSQTTFAFHHLYIQIQSRWRTLEDQYKQARLTTRLCGDVYAYVHAKADYRLAPLQKSSSMVFEWTPHAIGESMQFFEEERHRQKTYAESHKHVETTTVLLPLPSYTRPE